MVLEVIILLGTVCNEDACATKLAEAGIIQVLIELLNGQWLHRVARMQVIEISLSVVILK